MRPSLPSVAILSLFAIGSHAFAPPTSAATSSTRPRLAASNELSGMLSEYSGGAPLPPADVGMDTLAQAATAAQDAAAAAAAVASKGAAASKSGTAAAAGGIQFKPLVKAGVAGAGRIVPKPVQVDPSKVNAESVLEAQERTRENLATLKANLMGGNSKVNAESVLEAQERTRENLATLKANLMGGIGSLKETAGSIKESAGSMKAQGARPSGLSLDIESFVGSIKEAAGSLKETAQNLKLGHLSFDLDAKSLVNVDSVSVSPMFTDLAAALHLREYGGWYVAATLAVYASRQRSAGQDDANAAFESELASAREKASEAASAAGLAAQGATTAKKLALKMEKDLKKDGAQTVLKSSRSKVAQMEKDMMEKEMRALKKEVSLLKSQLAKSGGGTKQVIEALPAKTEIETEYPTKFVMKSDPEEDGRILELLKTVDEENKTKRKKKAANPEKKWGEEAKYVAAEKEKEGSRAMTKGVVAAQVKAEVSKKKKATTKKTRKAVKKKAAPKKTAAKRVPAAAADNWSLLAESTLKRKTVAQLTEYLAGKGVTATDSSGKLLRKAELLDVVRSL